MACTPEVSWGQRPGVQFWVTGNGQGERRVPTKKEGVNWIHREEEELAIHVRGRVKGLQGVWELRVVQRK